jgi:hypothetical protein
MKAPLQIFVSQDIDLTHFEEIIITALEGGSNYWYYLKDVDNIERNTQRTLSEDIAYNLYYYPEFKLDVYDVENPDDLLGTVTQKSMLNALELAYKDYNHIYVDLLEGTGDAETADVLFQLATMEQIVFG